MQRPGHLQLATAAFRPQLDAARHSLGAQDFPWYPYDTFGTSLALDQLLLPDALEILRKLAGSLPSLDLGCGDGGMSFFLESLGISGIDALDYPPTNHNGMRGIRKLKEALHSQVAIHSADIDAGFAPPQPLYGLTLFFGILYHLKNPFAVLETLAERSQFCLLSTRVAQRSPRGSKMNEEALAYLVGEYELNADESNYWIFSEAALRRLLERTGWRIRALISMGDLAKSEPIRPDRDQRAFCLIESLRAPRRDAPRLLSGWHQDEGGWRWTARDFSVEMTPHPLDNPSAVEFRFAIHPLAAEALDAVTISGRVAGREIPPQTFRGAGEHLYKGALPDIALTAPLRIDFALDRAYRPPAPDLRELGLQVTFQKTGPTLRREWTHPLRFA